MQGGYVSSVPRIRLVTIGACNDPIKKYIKLKSAKTFAASWIHSDGWITRHSHLVAEILFDSTVHLRECWNHSGGHSCPIKSSNSAAYKNYHLVSVHELSSQEDDKTSTLPTWTKGIDCVSLASALHSGASSWQGPHLQDVVLRIFKSW